MLLFLNFAAKSLFLSASLANGSLLTSPLLCLCITALSSTPLPVQPPFSQVKCLLGTSYFLLNPGSSVSSRFSSPLNPFPLCFWFSVIATNGLSVPFVLSHSFLLSRSPSPNFSPRIFFVSFFSLYLSDVLQLIPRAFYPNAESVPSATCSYSYPFFPLADPFASIVCFLPSPIDFGRPFSFCHAALIEYDFCAFFFP